MPSGHTLWTSVPPVHSAGRLIGTGVAIAPGLVLTALHVVDPEPLGQLTVGPAPVVRTATLPLRRYGPDRRLALRSYHRSRALTGVDAGTVDLSLLAAPTLDATALPLRHTPVNPGERLIVAGYPGGLPSITAGPVTSGDDADFVALLLLGPGASGAPALDCAGRLAGIVTLDHSDAGTILIGPQLVTAFLRCTTPLLAHLRPRPRRMSTP